MAVRIGVWQHVDVDHLHRHPLVIEQNVADLWKVAEADGDGPQEGGGDRILDHEADEKTGHCLSGAMGLVVREVRKASNLRARSPSPSTSNRESCLKNGRVISDPPLWHARHLASAPPRMFARRWEGVEREL